MAEEAKASEVERAEIPWVVAYLRNEVREVRRSVQRLDEKLDAGLARLDAKVDAKFEVLRREMIGQMWRGVGAVIAAVEAIATLFAWIVARGL